MTNAMKRKIDVGDAIDLQKNAREGEYYVLETFVDGIDYCDAGKTAWVWSIGRRLADGIILASLKSDLYQNSAFECLWLR